MIEFVREMNKNYLKITPETECNVPEYTMKMLENNDIQGLLPMHSVSINNKISYLYDISGRIPLEEMYLTKEFSAADIGYLAGFIVSIISTADRYMLDLDGVVFDIKYIFCAVSENSWSLVYNAALADDARRGLKSLLEYILSRLEHKDHNAVVLGYGLYKRICQDEISLSDVFDKIDMLVEAEEEKKDAPGNTFKIEYELKEKVNNDVIPEYIPEEKEICQRIFTVKEVLFAAAAGVAALAAAAFWGVIALVFVLIIAASLGVYIFKRNYKKTIRTDETAIPYTVTVPMLSAAFEDADVNEEPTILISGKGMRCLRRIVRKGDRVEEFMLEDSPLSIGSGTQADIILKDKGISRFHARISREGEMIFIKDMNSTNGTWVNDRRLTVYEMCPVRNGDIIRFAESRFELIDTSE